MGQRLAVRVPAARAVGQLQATLADQGRPRPQPPVVPAMVRPPAMPLGAREPRPPAVGAVVQPPAMPLGAGQRRPPAVGAVDRPPVKLGQQREGVPHLLAAMKRTPPTAAWCAPAPTVLAAMR